MNDECVLRCEEYYENKTEGDEYICKAKECNDRTPFSNGSCSLKEDLVEKENPVKCYLYGEMGEDGDVCTSKCPSDFVQVLFFFTFFFICKLLFNVFFILRLIILLSLMKINLNGLVVVFAHLSCLKQHARNT
jgi:hypothetical protein